MDRRIVERLRLGHGIKQISRDLHVCRKTVRKVRAQAEELGYLDEEVALPAYPSKLFSERQEKVSEADTQLLEHIDWIKERLESGWHKVTVFEQLPCTVSRAGFYRFLARHNLRSKRRKERCKVVPEIIHCPGEALQIDWGLLCTTVVDGKRKKVWILTAVLCHSRYTLVRVVMDGTFETTRVALESILEELGGVPRKLTTDNAKVFSLEASKYEPLLNPAFELWAEHYNVIIECLPPRSPQMKGKTERAIPFVRRLYEAHGEWQGSEEAQGYLNRKLEVANQRKHGTTKLSPAVVFQEEEKALLKPLPVQSYQNKYYSTAKVRTDGHVHFKGKYYSVEACHIGSVVTVIGSDTQVAIYKQSKLLEVHDRVLDPFRSKSTKKSHLEPWLRALDDDSNYLVRAEKLGPSVKNLVARIISRGEGFIDFRRVWGILNLDKKYDREAINEACDRAIENDQIGYRYVNRYLAAKTPGKKAEITAQEAAELPVMQKAKYARDPQEYSRYVALSLVVNNKQKKA